MSGSGVARIDERAFARGHAWWERLIGKTEMRLLIAFLVSFVMVSLMTFNEAQSGVDDDWAISVVLSDRYPDSGLCLFINAALSQLILSLNHVMPFMNWFIVFERVVTLFAFFAFNYAVLTYLSASWAFLLIAGVEYFFISRCTFASNFTFVSALAMMAGCMLLVGRFKANSSSVPSAVFGVLLCLVAFMLRVESFLLALPFFGMCFLFFVIRRRDEGGRRLLVGALPLCALMILCAGLWSYGSFEWEQPGWSEWRQYNQARAEISDYPMPDYDQVASYLSNAGVTEEAYYLARYWATGDTDYFDLDRIEAIASVAERTPASKLLSGFARYPLSLPNGRAIVIFFAIVAIAGLVAGPWRRRMVVFTLILFAYVLNSYFLGAGRLLDRVEFPIILYAACGIALVASRGQLPQVWESHHEAMRMTASVLSAAVFIMISGKLIGELAPSFDMEEASTMVHQQDYVPDHPLVDYVVEHDDHVYVWDTASFMAIEWSYGFKNLPTTEFLEQNICLGGWTVDSPFIEARNEQVGMPNIVKGLIDNGSARFICNGRDFPLHLLAFIQQTYYPDACMEIVDHVEVQDYREPFDVYRFYRAEGVQEPSA